MTMRLNRKSCTISLKIDDDQDDDKDDCQTDKKGKLFNREATMGANICKQGRPGQVSLPLSYFCICILSASYLYCVCTVYLGVGCDYAKYQILYLVNAKSHRSIHLLFMIGGRKGQFICHLFALLVHLFHDQGINSDSQYDIEMTRGKS